MSERFDPFNDDEPPPVTLAEKLEHILIQGKEEEVEALQIASNIFKSVAESLTDLINETPLLWKPENSLGLYQLSELLAQSYGTAEMLIDISENGSMAEYYEHIAKEQEHKGVLLEALYDEMKQKLSGKSVLPQA
jgi:hypothetical protein